MTAKNRLKKLSLLFLKAAVAAAAAIPLQKWKKLMKFQLANRLFI